MTDNKTKTSFVATLRQLTSDGFKKGLLHIGQVDENTWIFYSRFSVVRLENVIGISLPFVERQIKSIGDVHFMSRKSAENVNKLLDIDNSKYQTIIQPSSSDFYEGITKQTKDKGRFLEFSSSESNQLDIRTLEGFDEWVANDNVIHHRFVPKRVRSLFRLFAHEPMGMNVMLSKEEGKGSIFRGQHVTISLLPLETI